MLSAIEIKNFKSTSKLNLKFGRINVFIGENGSGKSTILEALTFVAAAEANKLDDEFLENRGIRVTSAKLMRSNFNEDSLERPIEIKVSIEELSAEGNSSIPRKRNYIINNDNDTYSDWKLESDTELQLDDGSRSISSLEFNKQHQEVLQKFEFLSERISSELKSADEKKANKFEKILSEINDGSLLKSIEAIGEKAIAIESKVSSELRFIKNFVIYAPQHKQLRNLKEEGQIRPLGIHGEGLFKLIREINKKQPDAMKDIETGLKLIDWYRSMEVSDELDLSDEELLIKDKYLISSFTQKSANEGFLYVLFYMALIVSKDTPKIFAIDNIDTALNPKLCAKIMSYLSELAVKYDKQLFLTTQNPAILDGINLNNKDEKLFVVSRSKQGHTKVKGITVDKKPKDSDGNYLRLSEAMMRGYLGGLPKGF